MTIKVPDFSGKRILVAGDVMLDRYWYGGTHRVSPEAPVPVVRVNEEDARPGGAGNVACNIVSLGAAGDVLGLIGDDASGLSLKAAMQAARVGDRLVMQPAVATTTKLRVISRHQQLLRLDFEERAEVMDGRLLTEAFAAAVEECDVVILSDYAKGALRDVSKLIGQARKASKPVLVDPKGTDFERYRGATILTPNLGEFEAVAGECRSEDELLEKGHYLRYQLDLEYLLVTRSEQGMSLFGPNDQVLTLPTHAREVFDVTGAGDTVIALLAAGLAAGCSMEDAATLANLGAGVVVGKLGAATVTPTELRMAAKHLLGGVGGVLEKDDLMDAVALARGRGERLVMTNGCFDILHGGHVAYLQEARALGDKLIVAVNDDESVAALKGKGRPIVPLAERMRVLAALDAVDYVVPFGGETPRDLVAEVLPDLLVKGGDYRAEDVAGYEEVTANGGEVRILRFEEGLSTTSIVERIRQLK
ncbi:MAG: bifunctional D-glycero-beta-D-manno-heptose-7-phosphate kinase/D-glycero-beta-D-manno-heptose 1-phosphate adenylyltransferase HldE [Gammaproteobacteria bacterium]|nr:bifunctional D-glycero-beta-D-manno-heptose-7-phosphate kinase/D-glycero-beta-D-manno-heptose 1-phosphate adenylyltransferase HldE [Gammaproteobacteria bacterium]